MDSSLDSYGRGLPICLITGRIAGDRFACGDCDPCSGKAAVSAPVKHLMAERDAFANKYEEAISQRDALVEALKRLKAAIRALGEIGPNRATYFEANVMRCDEAQRRWKELNDAGVQATAALASASASEEKKEMAG